MYGIYTGLKYAVTFNVTQSQSLVLMSSHMPHIISY